MKPLSEALPMCLTTWPVRAGVSPAGITGGCVIRGVRLIAFFEVPSGAWAPPGVLGRCGAVLTAPASAVAGVPPVCGEELAEAGRVGVGAIGRALEVRWLAPAEGWASWRAVVGVEEPSAAVEDSAMLPCLPLGEWAPEVSWRCCASRR